MIDEFLDFIESLNKKQPRLHSDSEYLVYYKSERIAKLSNPYIPDQFWIEFLITPQTDNQHLLDILYSDKFWLSDDIHIIDTKTNQAVSYLLAGNFDPATDETIDYFNTHKDIVVLRGPYRVEGIALPYFAYHPDPIATGSIESSTEKCECCKKYRGYTYTGPFYSEKEVETLCPWCITSGRAAKKFKGEFNEAPENIESIEIRTQLNKKTPSYHSWQEPMWLACCNDGCEFIGFPEKYELLDLRTKQGHNHLWLSCLTDEYLANYKPKPYNNPSIYKFKCRHCNKYHYRVDSG